MIVFDPSTSYSISSDVTSPTMSGVGTPSPPSAEMMISDAGMNAPSSMTWRAGSRKVSSNMSGRCMLLSTVTRWMRPLMSGSSGAPSTRISYELDREVSGIGYAMDDASDFDGMSSVEP